MCLPELQAIIAGAAAGHFSSALQAKAKILVVRDVERDDIEFISRTLGCLPIAHVDHMRPEKLGHAKLVEEETVRLPVLFPQHVSLSPF